MARRDGADPADRDKHDGATDEAGRASDATVDGGAPTPVTQTIGRVVLVVIAVLFVVFAVGNAQHVDFSWILGKTEVVQRAGERVEGGVRLILLLLGAFIAGLLVGVLALWHRRRGVGRRAGANGHRGDAES